MVGGVVQGVGFRPFVYRLATSLGINGDVRNSPSGVVIHAAATSEALTEFKRRLMSDAPPHARPMHLDASPDETRSFAGFSVVASSTDGASRQDTFAIPPDLAVCPECAAELRDPGNRRFRYPFINCTHCGPRFSIVTGSPYDRARTTMSGFPMCADCRREYEDPGDRRFHAEPIACAHCGPQVTLCDADGHVVAVREAAIGKACEAIRNGQIVAVKGIGGFHLMVDARNDEAVRRLRSRKGREARPLALMYPSLDAAEMDCVLDDGERALLQSAASPIVIVPQREKAGISALVAPGNPTLGIMLPYSPLHLLLLGDLGFAVVATSGNRSEEPICFDNDEAFARLGDIVDRFLFHDRLIARFIDDSVVRVAAGRPLLIRRARGYVPDIIALPLPVPDSLAVGAEQKSSVAMAHKTSAHLSRHIGNLDAPQAAVAFNDSISDLKQYLSLEPVVVAADPHPDYHSTRYAAALTIPTQGVQHHHAHILATMADNGLTRDVLGIAWDGTGYGADGSVWGGEFLKVSIGGFERVASLRPFPLLGGEKAIWEPRRIAYALLCDACEGAPSEHEWLECLREFPASDRANLEIMRTRGINSPLTSSVGRLFDGIASLLGLRQVIQFDGQAAMELEFAADGAGAPPYPYQVDAHDCLRLDWRPMVREIVTDRRSGVSVGRIAERFHATLVAFAVAIAGRVGTPEIALGGGCFQNKRLLELMVAQLQVAGFHVYWNRQVPCNDGGLALGQLYALACRGKGER